MKVSAISYSPVATNFTAKKPVNTEMFYRRQKNDFNSQAVKYHTFDYIGGFLAAIAAFLCLCAFAGRGR